MSITSDFAIKFLEKTHYRVTTSNDYLENSKITFEKIIIADE